MFSAILIAIRSATIKPQQFPANADPGQPSRLPIDPSSAAPLLLALGLSTVLYAPAGDPRSAALVSASTARMLLPPAAARTLAFDSAEDMDAYYRWNASGVLAGIAFDFSSAPGTIKYTLKMPPNSLPSMSTISSDSDACRPGNSCPPLQYYTSGFLALQRAIDDSIIAYTTSGNPSSTVLLPSSGNGASRVSPLISEMAFQPLTVSANTAYFRSLSGIYTALALMPIVQFMTVAIVKEKETRVKEALTMMGIGRAEYFIGTLAANGIIMLGTSLLMAVLFVVGKVTEGSNILLIFLLFFIYCLSLMGIALIITAFFSKSKLAGTVAALSTTVVAVISVPLNIVSSPAGNWGVSILSPAALALGVSQAVAASENGGLTFANFKSGGSYTFASSLLMLAVDTVLYFVVAVYLDSVVPTEFGVRRSWLYFLNFGSRSRSAATTGSRGNDQEAGVAASIDVAGLTKTFGLTTAVDNISLTMNKNSIFAILGHNGAGKTTLIQMLVGLFSPTSGTATVLGHDIRSEMHLIRKKMGICFQQDVLWEKLTVEEHLLIFGAVRDLAQSELEHRISYLLEELDLVDQRKSCADLLSGGEKRKLCVAIAILGNPEFLVLD
ncbi:ATP-binding cassette sub- A member 5, partial [Cladochytrium tenue]